MAGLGTDAVRTSPLRVLASFCLEEHIGSSAAFSLSFVFWWLDQEMLTNTSLSYRSMKTRDFDVKAEVTEQSTSDVTLTGVIESSGLASDAWNCLVTPQMTSIRSSWRIEGSGVTKLSMLHKRYLASGEQLQKTNCRG